jgi:hypothetical protein
MSRLEDARRRAVGAKRALAVGSAVAFVATIGLARAAHPGQAAHVKTSSATVANSSSSVTIVPQVSTHVS